MSASTSADFNTTTTDSTYILTGFQEVFEIQGYSGNETVCIGSFASDAPCVDVEMFASTTSFSGEYSGVIGL